MIFMLTNNTICTDNNSIYGLGYGTFYPFIRAVTASVTHPKSVDKCLPELIRA